ncbi:hypothetical protein ASE63_06710 [Bosea sp. Root381]|uniref:hypothetical protein n=1 Tax=Bosea sp. Root381 TaxID=1736524 RepID=UPI0006F817C9|nr:hypothetical protein [Bosea sp. Root381]KRE05986.1 hypothetical protein ASE63_06710 [Bosea sp. Root381]
MTAISVMSEVKRLVANGADPDRAAAVALVAAAAAMALHSHDERRREAGDVPREVVDLLDHQRELLRDWADRSVRPLLD